MRLVRFLAAGKSLVGLKDIEGRYRLPHGRALPQFGIVKDAGVPASAESTPQVHHEVAGVPVASAETDPEVTRVPVETPAAQSRTPFQSKPAPNLDSSRETNRSIFKKLFGWLPWYRKTLAGGAIPAFSSLPVQTELSLENVKVVRNDLLESDLEVKAARNKPVTVSSSKQQIGEQIGVVVTPSNPPRSGDGPGGN
jgi:hypothetical protein